MRMANINTSIKRQSLMYYNLNAAGLIQFSKKVDNTNVKVCFMAPGDVVMSITDFRNLGYQYLKYHCPACAIEVATQQQVNRVMRLRQQRQGISS